MGYSYDMHGWLSDTEISERTTGKTPPAHGAKTVGQPYPNFTGVDWVMAVYVKPSPQIPLAAYKTQKIAAIRARFTVMVDVIKADAAPYEVATWPVQSAEYSSWMANNLNPVPYVSALAAARGITVAALMVKIGVKVAGLATVQGNQHALETAINDAATKEAVDAVVVPA